VDSVGDVGQYTAIAIGADSLPVISYYDATNGDLKVAKCVNAACTGSATITTVDRGGNVGFYIAMAIGTDGLPVMSYSDVTNNDLKVLKCSNAACLAP
jgi:succinyl-CoA synthetase alpha subunit